MHYTNILQRILNRYLISTGTGDRQAEYCRAANMSGEIQHETGLNLISTSTLSSATCSHLKNTDCIETVGGEFVEVHIVSRTETTSP